MSREQVYEQLKPIARVPASLILMGDMRANDDFNICALELCIVGHAYGRNSGYAKSESHLYCKTCKNFGSSLYKSQRILETFTVIPEPTPELLELTLQFVKHFNEVHRRLGYLVK